jgi:alpha-ribazole phosphatase
MEIYLVRHTPPLIGKGLCYGQTNTPLDWKVFEEAYTQILGRLPPRIDALYTSPLERCLYLAQRIQQSRYPACPLLMDQRLQEMNFGQWEGKSWSAIPPSELDPWMSDFVHVRAPEGECYRDLYQRSVAFFKDMLQAGVSSVIVTHSGVIRSILSYFSGIKLADSFTAFELSYSCVVHLDVKSNKFSFGLL